MQTPSVAIVILNWNGRAFLEKFLPSVLASAQEDPAYRIHKKVIVADNASTDDSVEFVRTHYPQVAIIQNSSNEGFAKGYNTALKQVEADYYVLLNSDVEVTPGWIEPVIRLMGMDSTIAACQPKIMAYQHKTQFEYAGASGGWLDKFGYPFMRGRVFDICETDAGQYEDAQPCFWASGAAFFVRADVYRQLGGLDEFFFAHQEEIDFCWRAQLAGYKIYVQPVAVVYHVGGGTLPTGNSRKAFLNFRNNLIMLAKNLPFAAALWKVPFRMLLDILSGLRGLAAGDKGYFFAIFRSHYHFIGWIFRHRGRSVFPAKKDGKLYGWYNGSVVWQYFIRKKRTFLEIIDRK